MNCDVRVAVHVVGILNSLMCVQHREGMFSTVGGIMIHVGGIMIHVGGYHEYRGGVQYRGECSVPWGI